MIEIRAILSPDLVQPLEDYFCEELSQWSIVHPRPEDEVILSGYFASEEEGIEKWEDLRTAFPALSPLPEVLPVKDEDWMEAYKFHLRPWSTGPLHWIPEWERSTFAPSESEVALFLDSGMAFGTGSHETTRLCAQALVRYRQQNGTDRIVIDAGCGSGILALSAAILGFPNVFGFDNDPEAIRVSRSNAEANSIRGDRVMFAEAGIEEGLKGRSCDLLLANIQANILEIYAEELIAGVNPGGTLALSGILVHEADKVAQCFIRACESVGRFPSLRQETDGEWSLVELQNF